jgi:hypothetical protein
MGSIDVQKARGPLAWHEARFFSLTRARHDTEWSGPGLSPARIACRARQEFEPVGLTRARPVINRAFKPARSQHSQVPTAPQIHGLPPNGPNSALRRPQPRACSPSRTVSALFSPERRRCGNPNPNALSLVALASSPCGGSWIRILVSLGVPLRAQRRLPLRAWLPPVLLRCSRSRAPPVLSVPCAAASGAPYFPGCLRCSRSRAPALLQSSLSLLRRTPVLPPRELRCSLVPPPGAANSALRPGRSPVLPPWLPAPSSRRGALRCSLLPARRIRCSLLQSSDAPTSLLPPTRATHPVLPRPKLWCSHLPATSYWRDASGAPSSRAQDYQWIPQCI